MSLPADPQVRREILRRASRLSGLVDNPSFKELQEEAERKERRIQKSLIARVMAPPPGAADQRDIDFQRGFVQGMHYLLNVPAGAKQTLEQVSEEETSERERAS